MEPLWQKEPVEATFEPKQWLIERARPEMAYLLAHADDGVIWGIVEGDQLSLSGNAFAGVAVLLRRETLQQARLFGPAGELLLWRSGDSFEARLIADGENPAGDSFEETHYLWGSATEQASQGFTLMEEGQQGFYHALPLPLYPGEQAALQVRHYIAYDDQDQAYVALSRLVNLIKIGGKNGAKA